MTIAKDTARLVVLLPQATKDKLEKLAAADNRSMSNYVVMLIEQHIKKALEAL